MATKDNEIRHDKDFHAFTWMQGKQFLAEVRGGDYAHAGEEKAIEIAFKKIAPDAEREILDVGSGLGATANFIYEHGFGKVTGFDVEEQGIEYATKHYPKVKFFTCDASDFSSLQKELKNKKFDLICLFHSLCVMKNPFEALKALESFAKPKATLLIFEYSDLSQGKHAIDTCNIFSLEQMKKELSNVRWTLKEKETVNLDQEFTEWYQDLINRATEKKKQLVEKFGEEYYNHFLKGYLPYLNALKQKLIGGFVLYAEAKGA
jgi:ubiquinone/menaquinone biosynthesis C-methylase UbiE